MLPRDKIRAALTRGASGEKRSAAKNAPALVAFITAGYPEPSEFLNVLRAVAGAADAVEIGVPFSDPMADGVTIQRSSQHAIEHGVSLTWILDQLARRDFELTSPVLLMSYLNPLLAFGLEKLAARAAEVGVSGVIVPDLPYEESAPLRAALTGGESTLPPETSQYLAAVKAASQVPVCAGFGVRRPDQVATIARHADGVIVGSALVEVLERGEDPARFLRSLRG